MKIGKDVIGVGTGAMIFNSQGKVLVTKRGEKARNEVGLWEFPGGKVEFGERRRDAIKREVLEEFGIVIDISERLNVQDHILTEEKQHWVSTSYIAKLMDGEPKIKEPDKCTEFRWLRLYDIKLDKLSKATKSDFLLYTKKYGSNAPLFVE